MAYRLISNGWLTLTRPYLYIFDCANKFASHDALAINGCSVISPSPSPTPFLRQG
jgi:hypothetical protein